MGFDFRLECLPGINSDDTTYAAKGRWADGSNVRFVNGKPQVIGHILEPGFLTTAMTVRAIKSWTRNDGTQRNAYAGGNSLLVVSSMTTHDITPSPAPTVINALWALDLWGEDLIALPLGGTLYIWQNNTAVRATEITQAPNNICDMAVTPQRQILVGGCNEEVSGNFNPRCIRACDIEDYTDWTTSSANNAFEHILEAGAGAIVALKMVGDYVAVLTTTGLWMGTYVGDPGQAYRWDRVATGCGMKSHNGSFGRNFGERNGVTTLGGSLYWLSHDLNFWVWTPGQAPQIIACPIIEDMRRNFSRSRPGVAFCGTIAKFNEVWWFYVDSRDTASTGTNPSRYLACNVKDGTWFRGQLVRSAMEDASSSEPFGNPRLCDHLGAEYLHEASFGTKAFSWFVETSDLTFDGTGRRRVMIRGARPDFENQADDVSLTVNVRSRPRETATAKGPYTLTAATTKKDFRASGRLVSLKFSGDEGNAGMRLGTPVFDSEKMGER